MSENYKKYLYNHIDAVKKCYQLLTGKELKFHDETKFSAEEFHPYDNNIYPEARPEGMTDEQAKAEFDVAWLHHQNNNPHHWQYWILINDKDEIVPLEMPLDYVFEMVADWGAFALIAKDANALKEWYSVNRDRQIIAPKTRELVDSLVIVLTALIEQELQQKTAGETK